jgi:transcriptional regulator with XRE-family HTH domain
MIDSNNNFSSPNQDYPEINKIRMLREGIGLSQDYVAKKLNITQQAYSKIEKSPDSATLQRLKQLSEILGVKVNSLVGEDDMYIEQNFHQQGGNAATVMYVTGLADRERLSMLQQIESLQKQVEVLTKIIDQKL